MLATSFELSGRRQEPRKGTQLIGCAVALMLTLAGCGGGSDDSTEADSGNGISSIAAVPPAVAPAASSPTDATPSPTAPPTPAPEVVPPTPPVPQPPTTLQVNSQDIFAQAVASRPFVDLGWQWAVECASQVVAGQNVPETGLTSTATADDWGALRFASVLDPKKAASKAYLFRLNRDDAQIHSGRRCELSSSPTASGSLPRDETFWYTVAVYLPDWAATPDEVIIMQWHGTAGSTVLNPFMALSVRNDKLQLVVRSNANLPVSKETTASQWFTLPGALPVNRWVNFTFKANISTNAASKPFLQLWQDGQLVVDHTGPVGYAALETQFLKLGMYHWTGTANPWPTEVTTRTVYMKQPTLVRDMAGRYKEPDLRTYVNER